MTEKTKVRCPKCQESYEVLIQTSDPRALAKDSIRCEECGTVFTLEKVSSEKAAETSKMVQDIINPTQH